MGVSTRVLVIDDSRAVRMIVAKVFNDEPDIEVIGMAEHGAQGVAMQLLDEGETRAVEPGYRLTARAPILRLVASGGPESLALDLVIDLRLYDNADRTLRYASLLSSGPELSARTPFIDRSPLYLRPVERRPPARAVAEWCGEAGAALVAEDIESGLRAIAEQFVRDFDR